MTDSLGHIHQTKLKRFIYCWIIWPSTENYKVAPTQVESRIRGQSGSEKKQKRKNREVLRYLLWWWNENQVRFETDCAKVWVNIISVQVKVQNMLPPPNKTTVRCFQSKLSGLTIARYLPSEWANRWWQWKQKKSVCSKEVYVYLVAA